MRSPTSATPSNPPPELRTGRPLRAISPVACRGDGSAIVPMPSSPSWSDDVLDRERLSRESRSGQIGPRGRRSPGGAPRLRRVRRHGCDDRHDHRRSGGERLAADVAPRRQTRRQVALEPVDGVRLDGSVEHVPHAVAHRPDVRPSRRRWAGRRTGNGRPPLSRRCGRQEGAAALVRASLGERRSTGTDVHPHREGRVMCIVVVRDDDDGRQR